MTPEDLSDLTRSLEQSVLGSCLIAWDNVGEDVQKVIQFKHWSSEPHRLIWQAILAIAAEGATPDLLLVAHALDQAGATRKAGGAGYLVSLVEIVPDTTNAAAYGRRVRDAWVARKMKTS